MSSARMKELEDMLEGFLISADTLDDTNEDEIFMQCRRGAAHV